MHPASVPLRVFYCLAIVSVVLPWPVSGWVALGLRGGTFSWFMAFAPLLLLVVGIWRIYQVAAFPHTLASYMEGGALKALRILGLIAMGCGVLTMLFRIAPGLLVGALGGQRSGMGVEFYVVGIYLALVSPLGPLGIVLFEGSRLMGFERHAHAAS
jgi:hypothetical protein